MNNDKCGVNSSNHAKKNGGNGGENVKKHKKSREHDMD